MKRDPVSVLDRTAGDGGGMAADAAAARLVPGYADGVRALVAMRESILAARGHEPAPGAAEGDIRRLLASLFSPEILELQVIDWASPSAVLDRIVQYEAVHDIADREELRRRLQPEDRRCYGLFHPAMPHDPVIFTEVALTSGPVASIDLILERERTPLRAESATTAIFYSISGSQPGLRGIAFGGLMIARVLAHLRTAVPRLNEFLTLSPIPGLRSWLSDRSVSEDASAFRRMSAQSLADSAPDSGVPGARDELRRAAAAYLLDARREDGRPADPVARFHLGNGARLDHVYVDADRSARGVQESFGLMASYRYERKAR